MRIEKQRETSSARALPHLCKWRSHRSAQHPPVFNTRVVRQPADGCALKDGDVLKSGCGIQTSRRCVDREVVIVLLNGERTLHCKIARAKHFNCTPLVVAVVAWAVCDAAPVECREARPLCFGRWAVTRKCWGCTHHPKPCIRRLLAAHCGGCNCWRCHWRRRCCSLAKKAWSCSVSEHSQLSFRKG
jgi:hypothetical protein